MVILPGKRLIELTEGSIQAKEYPELLLLLVYMEERYGFRVKESFDTIVQEAQDITANPLRINDMTSTMFFFMTYLQHPYGFTVLSFDNLLSELNSSIVETISNSILMQTEYSRKEEVDK